MIRYEVASAITVATFGANPRITQDQAREAIEEFLALGLPTMDTDHLIVAAYALVHQYGIALYDGLYLALAQRLQRPLITADNRFYQRVRSLPSATWIGDYSS